MPEIPNGDPIQFSRDWYVGEKVNGRHFTCARCEHVYLTFTTEAQANREYLASGQDIAAGDISEVCDDCYQDAMARAREGGLL